MGNLINRLFRKSKKPKRKMSIDSKEKQRTYMRRYMREKYRTDPEWRERVLKNTRRWQRKNKKRYNKYQRELNKRRRENPKWVKQQKRKYKLYRQRKKAEMERLERENKILRRILERRS